jgi:hypothetical protein
VAHRCGHPGAPDSRSVMSIGVLRNRAALDVEFESTRPAHARAALGGHHGGIEYYLILPKLQPLVVMQVPFWTALGVHVTSGLLYPFYPQVRAIVTRQPVRRDVLSRTRRRRRAHRPRGPRSGRSRATLAVRITGGARVRDGVSPSHGGASRGWRPARHTSRLQRR